MFYGIDGCRGPAPVGGRGWLIVRLADDGRFDGAAAVEAFARAVEFTRNVALALVDIPIGLPDGVRAVHRACDLQARSLVGERRSSVFPAPARCCLGAESYAEALSLHRGATGRGISRQAWHLCPRIGEVDGLLRSRADLRARYREAHPEVCFAGLNAWVPAAHPKRLPQGVRERLSLLAAWAPDAPRFFRAVLDAWPRAAVSPADVLDAMALALAAREALARGCPTLPERPQTDDEGLPMEMVCPAAPPASAVHGLGAEQSGPRGRPAARDHGTDARRPG